MIRCAFRPSASTLFESFSEMTAKTTLRARSFRCTSTASSRSGSMCSSTSVETTRSANVGIMSLPIMAGSYSLNRNPGGWVSMIARLSEPCPQP